MPGEAEDPAASGGDELSGHGERVEPHAVGLPEPSLARKGEPHGQQVEGDLHDL